MKNLFEFNDMTREIMLNREWIMLVPEFKTVLTKSKGVPGDADGRKKFYAIRVFTFIYLFADFRSPLRGETDEKKRWELALRDSQLEVEDMKSKDNVAALQKYEEYLKLNARALRTVQVLHESLNKADEYFGQIDFNERDKKGELVYSMSQYLANIQKIDLAYKSIESFEERVYAQLANSGSARGSKELGGTEGKRGEWIEKGRPKAEGTDFKELGSYFTDKLKQFNPDKVGKQRQLDSIEENNMLDDLDDLDDLENM